MNNSVDYMTLVSLYRDFTQRYSPLAEVCESCLETYAILSEVPGVDLNVLYSRLCDLSHEGQLLFENLSQAYRDTHSELKVSENEIIRQLLEGRLERIRKRFKLIEDIESYRVCIGRIGGIVMQ